MKSIAVVLFMIFTVAVICESAAISKQQRDVRAADAAEKVSRWLAGLMENKRYIIPTIKQRATEQQREQVNELEDRDYLGAIGISGSSSWGSRPSSSSHWSNDDWP